MSYQPRSTNPYIMTQNIIDIKGSLNSINDNLTDGIGGTSDKFRFGTDGNGNYGYIKKVSGADTFFPFSSGDLIGFNFYNKYECNRVTLQNNITHFEYFPSNPNNPLFTVTKTISGVGANDYFTITLTANKSTNIIFECEYTESSDESTYKASAEIKFNDVDILTKHTLPTTTVTNIIRENVSLQVNDTITLKFYEYYGAWNGKITVK